MYGLALYRFPLLANYARPLQNLSTLTESAASTGLLIAGWIMLLFAGYALGARTIFTSRRHPFTLPLIVIFPLIFSGLLLLVYPVTSTDLYDYLFRGHMLVYYQANPFIHVPQDFASDPLFPFVGWPHAVTAYGPLWEQISRLIAWLVGEVPSTPNMAAAGMSVMLLRLLLAYKLLDAFGFLLCGAAIWAALGYIAPDQQHIGLYLWLWNPLALWESVAAGHNDTWMIFPVIIAIWSLSWGYRAQAQARVWARRGVETWVYRGKEILKRQRAMSISALVFSGSSPTLPFRPIARRPFYSSPRPSRLPAPPPHQRLIRLHPQIVAALIALVALTLGGLIKYLPLVLGPAVLAAALRQLPTWRERFRLVLIGGGLCIALVALAYAPFWTDWLTLRNFSDRRAIFTISWLAALHALLSHAGISEDLAQTTTATIGLGLLVVGTVWTTWKAWTKPRDVAAHMLWLTVWFLLLCNPAPQAWYMLWPLAIIAIQPQRTSLVRITIFGCCLVSFVYVINTFVISALRL